MEQNHINVVFCEMLKEVELMGEKVMHLSNKGQKGQAEEPRALKEAWHCLSCGNKRCNRISHGRERWRTACSLDLWDVSQVLQGG